MHYSSAVHLSFFIFIFFSLYFFFFFFYCYGDHRDLHSFPTRRSSDLDSLWHQRHPIVLRKRPEVLEAVLTDSKDRKSTRLNSSHRTISYAVFCLKKKKNKKTETESMNRTRISLACALIYNSCRKIE